MAAVAVASLALAATGIAVAQSGGALPGPPPASVRVGQAQVMTLQNHWEVIGRLTEVRSAVVAAEGLGRVIEVPVEEGQAVTGGQTVLARIDDVWVRSNLDEAQATLKERQATVAEARAQLEQTQRELKRLEELLAAESAKQKEVDDARDAQRIGQARLERALAQVASAQTLIARIGEDLQRLTVRAPFDGYVIRKRTEVGQWMTPGAAVAEVVSRGTIDAEIHVPERLINGLTVGQKIQVVVEPLHQECEGAVRAIVPVAEDAARTFPVRVTLSDQGGKLKAGMSVLARVPTGQEGPVLTVPRDAVLRGAGGNVVWMVLDGKALPVSVEVLFGHRERYAVRVAGGGEGPPLRDGATVVTEGAERLFPMRAVMPVSGPSTQP